MQEAAEIQQQPYMPLPCSLLNQSKAAISNGSLASETINENANVTHQEKGKRQIETQKQHSTMSIFNSSRHKLFHFDYQ